MMKEIVLSRRTFEGPCRQPPPPHAPLIRMEKPGSPAPVNSQKPPNLEGPDRIWQAHVPLATEIHKLRGAHPWAWAPSQDTRPPRLGCLASCTAPWESRSNLSFGSGDLLSELRFVAFGFCVSLICPAVILTSPSSFISFLQAGATSCLYAAAKEELGDQGEEHRVAMQHPTPPCEGPESPWELRVVQHQ